MAHLIHSHRIARRSGIEDPHVVLVLMTVDVVD